MLVKEVLHKLVLTVWFHLYEALEQIKVIEVNKIKTLVASGSGSGGKELTSLKEPSGVMEIFHILIRVWAIIQVYAPVRSHQMLHYYLGVSLYLNFTL